MASSGPRHGHAHHEHDSDSDEELQRVEHKAPMEQLKKVIKHSPLYGALECAIAVVELIVIETAFGFLSAFYQKFTTGDGLETCSVVGASRVEILFCTLGHDIVPILAAFLLTSAVSIGVIKYYLWRYRPLLQLSNLTVRRPTHEFWYGLSAYVACGLCTVFLVTASHAPDGRPLALSENYLLQGAARVDYVRVLQMVLWVPIKEELVFRAVIYLLFFEKQRQRLMSVLLSATFFGIFHLLNLFVGGTSFSFFYVLMQMFFGYLIGVFFGLEFVRTGSIWQSCVLHSLNNLFASMVPLHLPFSITSPLHIFQLVSTFVIHVLLVAASMSEFDKKRT